MRFNFKIRKMAITRLKRKDRKNKARANNRQRIIKQLLTTPVIKNVDVEALKAQFTNAAPAAATPVATPASEAAPAPEAAAE